MVIVIYNNQLQEDGFHVGRDRVLKYIGVLGISAIYPRKKPSISCKDGQHKVYSYFLDKYWINFGKTKRVHVPKSNQVWSGDITYTGTSRGYMYLSAIIDWHSKAILSYKLSNTMDTRLVTETLQEALSKYPAPAFFNSYQGSQYTSHKHTELLKNHNIQISMNGRGRSIDNIVMEIFFRTLKYNYLFINEFKNIKALKEGISSYITKYN
ncbi:MAG: IS3 family transposase [Candidatus Cardinium sp.]|nr:IS3 family transposase [Candidatus Cardinium sp.]